MSNFFDPERESTRFQKGWKTLTAAAATDSPRVVNEVATVAPDLARWIVEFGYGDAYSRSELAQTQRQLITIGMLTALGDCEPQLKVHAAMALRVGVSVTEIIEVIMHAVPFAGFPRALNALTAVRPILERSATNAS